MKTPEEIATDIITALDLGGDTEGQPKKPGALNDATRSGWLDGDVIPDLIAEAVRADRKQRNPGSASDREELARKALDLAPGADRERALASVVRLLIGRPDVIETVDQMLDRLMPALLAYDQREGLAHQGIGRAGLRFGIEAGLNAAFDSWEPDEYAEPETVVAALRRALIDRGNVAAGNWVSFHEQKIWDSMIGPLLDRIEVAASLTSTLWEPSGEPLPDAAAETARFDHDVEQAIRSEARSAITARRTHEFDEHDPRL